MKRIHLSIPQACHENWNEMTQAEKGRFCNACQKTVIDFRNMSDRQLAEFFRKPVSNACGHFHHDQLDREIEIPKKRIPWIKYFFQITWPALVFALKASGQSKGKIKVDVTQTSVLKPAISKSIEIEKSSVANACKSRKQAIENHISHQRSAAFIESNHEIVKDTSNEKIHGDSLIAKNPTDPVISEYPLIGMVGGIVSRVSYQRRSTEKKPIVEAVTKKIPPVETPLNFVHPNPVNAGSELTVSIADMKNVDEIRIVSSVGQVLLRIKENQSDKSIITIPSQFTAGVYVVEISAKEKILKTTKLVVVK